MEYNSIIKFGRILFYAGIGWLSAGLITSGVEGFESFDMWVALIATVIGLFIIFVFKNKAKLEDLQTSSSQNRTCPNCGLHLSRDCQKCPKCNTIFEYKTGENYGSNNN